MSDAICHAMWYWWMLLYDSVTHIPKRLFMISIDELLKTNQIHTLTGCVQLFFSYKYYHDLILCNLCTSSMNLCSAWNLYGTQCGGIIWLSNLSIHKNRFLNAYNLYKNTVTRWFEQSLDLWFSRTFFSNSAHWGQHFLISDPRFFFFLITYLPSVWLQYAWFGNKCKPARYLFIFERSESRVLTKRVTPALRLLIWHHIDGYYKLIIGEGALTDR